MSDIWKFVQRAAHHVQPKSRKAQAASDEMERDHYEAVGLGRYMLRELAERAAVAAAEQEVANDAG